MTLLNGRQSSGTSCWTVDSAGSGWEVATPFRCGESTPSGALSIFPTENGSKGSALPDSAAIVGAVGADVATVKVVLANGAVDQVPINQNGTFSWSSTSADGLPTSVEGFNASGSLVVQKALTGGQNPDCSANGC